MGRTMTATVDVDVDIDLNEFNDDDLIEELEARGYKIFNEGEENSPLLNKYDCELILDRLGWDAKPGDDLGNVIEKVRNTYYGR